VCWFRDPQPVATVQPTDTYATCAMITAEIQANNIKVRGWRKAWKSWPLMTFAQDDSRGGAALDG
jgi:hypothetical protein